MLAALIVALAYVRPLLFGETFALRDQISWTVPSRMYFAASIAQGRLPEWCDGIGLGIAFAGNPGYGVAYPPTWLVTLLPAALASDVLLIAHVAWLAVGTSLVARRLGADRMGGVVAGVAAALSGYVASVLVCGIPILILAWTPWLLWAADRLALAADRRERGRATVLLAALWAAQALSGVTGVVDTVLVVFAWTLVRAERRGPTLAWLLVSGVAALPLAAVSLWPALHLLGPSERAGGIPFDHATVWSLHPLRLGELVWPRLFANGMPDEAAGHAVGPSWALSVYLGAPVVALAGYAAVRGERHARALLAVAAGLVVLALGRYTPIYAVYRFLFLPERLLRFPEKHLSGVVFLVAVVAGVGFTRAFAGPASRRLLATLLLAAVAFAAGRSFGAALACAGVAGAIVVRRPSLALAVIALHLAVVGWSTQPLVPRPALTRVPALLAPIAHEATTTPRARLYRPPTLRPRSNATSDAESSIADRDTGMPDAALPFGIAHIPGYEPALEARWHAVWDAGAATGARLLERFDVEWVVLPTAVAARAGFEPRAELGGLALAEVPRRRPRAFVSTRWRFADDDAARAALFDGEHVGQLQLAGSGAPSTGGGGDVPCTIRSTRPEAVDLQCRAPAAGYAVLLDSFADGWRATVDGAPAPIVRADVVARAVAVPAGEHTIAMRYRTPGLRAGALISLLAWLAWLVAAVTLRRR